MSRDFDRAEDMYTLSWAKEPETKLIGELKVPLPKMPSRKRMKNYDQKSLSQKFRRSVVPGDINYWAPYEVEEYVKAQWHRRVHGEWWLIKGEPFTFQVRLFCFLYYWTMHSGKKPDFRIEALDFFLAWYLYINPDPNIFGMFDMKPRRVGDTEKVIFIAWEKATRFRNMRVGLMSYTDTEAAKNFSRLAKGNRNMPFMFKPKWSGSDKDHLAFMSPNEVNTLKKLREKAKKIDFSSIDEDFIGSLIDYEATKTGKYDGDQLHFYHLDEVWKILPHLMDVKKQWSNIKRVISLHLQEVIVGKAILCSTVEEKTKDADKKELTLRLRLQLIFGTIVIPTV